MFFDPETPLINVSHVALDFSSSVQNPQYTVNIFGRLFLKGKKAEMSSTSKMQIFEMYW
jgi:hypothetical protein